MNNITNNYHKRCPSLHHSSNNQLKSPRLVGDNRRHRTPVKSKPHRLKSVDNTSVESIPNDDTTIRGGYSNQPIPLKTRINILIGDQSSASSFISSDLSDSTDNSKKDEEMKQ